MSLYHEIWQAKKDFVLAIEDLATWNKTLEFCPSTFYRLNISRLKKLVLPLSQFQSEQRDAWRVKWELDFPTFPQENKIWVTWLGFRQNKQTGGWDLGRIWARKCDLYPPDPVPQKPQRTQTFFFYFGKSSNNLFLTLHFSSCTWVVFPYEPNPFEVVSCVHITNGIDCTLTFSPRFRRVSCCGETQQAFSFWLCDFPRSKHIRAENRFQ